MLSNGMNVALDDQEKTLSMLTVLAKLWICIPKDGSDTGGFDLIVFFFCRRRLGRLTDLFSITVFVIICPFKSLGSL